MKLPKAKLSLEFTLFTAINSSFDCFGLVLSKILSLIQTVLKHYKEEDYFTFLFSLCPLFVNCSTGDWV